VKVLVVGGGIIGCSLAYELTKAGCAVTLLERSTPGAEASSAAAGVLSPLAEATHAASSRLAVEAWDAADLRTREPAMSTNVRGAMFVKSDHWVNNQRLVVAYAQAAVAAGVAMISGSAVSRVIVEDGRARGVVADGDRFEADAVVLAAGAWTAELAASFGGRLPVEPRRGQMVALGHVPPLLSHCVHANDVYLVPRPSGELLIGATVERVGAGRPADSRPVAGGRQSVGRHRTLSRGYSVGADHRAAHDRVDRRRHAVDRSRRVSSRPVHKGLTQWTGAR
jgi:glycine/D-amino acid oxidase-like deaminating enzyme